MARDILEISRRRKRRWVVVKITLWVAVSIFILAIIITIFYIPALRIKSVSFIGIKSIDQNTLSEEIKKILDEKYLLVLPKDNLIFLPQKELDAVISSNLRIESFSISRSFPSKLDVFITERTPWAVWCDKTSDTISKCYLADTNSYIFEPAPIVSGSIILQFMDERRSFGLGQKFLSDVELSTLKYFISELPKTLNQQVSYVDIKGGDVFSLVTISGWSLILDSSVTDPKKAFDNLSLALNSLKLKDKVSNLEYVDLRSPDKVYYRLKSATTTSNK